MTCDATRGYVCETYKGKVCPVVIQNFSDTEGAPTQWRCANLLFWQFFQKTAESGQNIGPRYKGAFLAPPWIRHVNNTPHKYIAKSYITFAIAYKLNNPIFYTFQNYQFHLSDVWNAERLLVTDQKNSTLCNQIQRRQNSDQKKSSFGI